MILRLGRFGPGLVAIALLVAGLASFPALAAGKPEAGPASPATPVSTVPTEDKVVALTFDAGSDAGHTQAILDILRDEGVKATFFLTADWLEANPDLGKAIVAAGHDIGNHTKDHPHMTQLTDEEIKAELAAVEDGALATMGKSTKPFFRPPFGEYDDRVAMVAGQAGYRYLVMWTVDSLDWKLIPPEEVTKRIVDGAKPGAIFLMHVGSQTYEPQALPETIRRLREAGYGFVTLSELLAGTGAGNGQTLHTVARGETLYSIARRYGVTVEEIMAANGLANANQIDAGSTLIIPGTGGSGGASGSAGGGGAGGSGGGGDQGGYGADQPAGAEDAGHGGFFARLADGLAALWHRLVAAIGRLFAKLS